MPPLWLVFIAYYLASTLLHLYISNLLFVNPITASFGSFKVSDYMGTFGKTTLFFLALYLAFRCLKGTCRLVTISYWGIWLVTVLVTSRLLLFHPNEYIHYPQYAILAVLLALCIDSDRSKVPWARILFWTTTMGVLDEMNQYFFLCKTYGDYLDFNDMFMNLQGAQAGLLLFYGFRHLPKRHPELKSLVPVISSILSFEGITVLTVSVVISFFLYTGTLQLTAPYQISPGGVLDLNGTKTIFLERLPHITGAWSKTPIGQSYYVFTSITGMAVLIFTGFIFSTIVRFSKYKDI